eukprot:SAG31_NODE_180_length_21118_cov_62.152671_10_plen_68_part_00
MLLTGLPSAVWLPNSQIPIAPGVNGIVASASSVTGASLSLTAVSGVLAGWRADDGVAAMHLNKPPGC